jgi:iron complex outermembrane receptor protein
MCRTCWASPPRSTRCAAASSEANERAERAPGTAGRLPGRRVGPPCPARRQVLEQGDVEEALNAAAQIGDDKLQRQAQGRVVPESFTHGTSAQRVAWFKRGVTGNPLGRRSRRAGRRGAPLQHEPLASVLTGDALLRSAVPHAGRDAGRPARRGRQRLRPQQQPARHPRPGRRPRAPAGQRRRQVDASNLSFDHAVAMDPLVVERLEVLRGPAALLYGGNATGGVVNAHRQPHSARAAARACPARRARAWVVPPRTRRRRWCWTAVPAAWPGMPTPLAAAPVTCACPPTRPSKTASRWTPAPRAQLGRPRAGRRAGRGLGRQAGLPGAVGRPLDNDYGVTVEPDVFIRLQRERLALAGELRGCRVACDAGGRGSQPHPLPHEEVEGSGEVGTTFSSRGNDLRLQAAPRAAGPAARCAGRAGETLRFRGPGRRGLRAGHAPVRRRAVRVGRGRMGATGAGRSALGTNRVRVSERSGGERASATRSRAASSRSTPFAGRHLAAGPRLAARA